MKRGRPNLKIDIVNESKEDDDGQQEEDALQRTYGLSASGRFSKDLSIGSVGSTGSSGGRDGDQGEGRREGGEGSSSSAAAQSLEIDKSGVRLRDKVTGMMIEKSFENELSENDWEGLVRLNVLGRGASSFVQRARCSDGRELAIKNLTIFEQSKRHQLVREIRLLYNADCSCLIEFLGCRFAEGRISIALEYMDEGDTAAFAKKHGPLPEEIVAAIAYQALFGLSYLYYEKQVHRDIKPQNILINSNGEVSNPSLSLPRSLPSFTLSL